MSGKKDEKKPAKSSAKPVAKKPAPKAVAKKPAKAEPAKMQTTSATKENGKVVATTQAVVPVNAKPVKVKANVVDRKPALAAAKKIAGKVTDAGKKLAASPDKDKQKTGQQLIRGGEKVLKAVARAEQKDARVKPAEKKPAPVKVKPASKADVKKAKAEVEPHLKPGQKVAEVKKIVVKKPAAKKPEVKLTAKTAAKIATAKPKPRGLMAQAEAIANG